MNCRGMGQTKACDPWTVTRLGCLRPLGECRSSFLWLITKKEHRHSDTWHPQHTQLISSPAHRKLSLKTLQHFAGSSVNPTGAQVNQFGVGELKAHLMIQKARARPLVINQLGDRQTGKRINDSRGPSLKHWIINQRRGMASHRFSLHTCRRIQSCAILMISHEAETPKIKLNFKFVSENETDKWKTQKWCVI